VWFVGFFLLSGSLNACFNELKDIITDCQELKIANTNDKELYLKDLMLFIPSFERKPSSDIAIIFALIKVKQKKDEKINLRKNDLFSFLFLSCFKVFYYSLQNQVQNQYQNILEKIKKVLTEFECQELINACEAFHQAIFYGKQACDLMKELPTNYLNLLNHQEENKNLQLEENFLKNKTIDKMNRLNLANYLFVIYGLYEIEKAIDILKNE